MADFKTSSFQEIFDTVCTQLAAQGGPSMKFIKTTYDTNGSVSCAYRGENGRMCAMGVLIKDEEYDPKFEGKTAFKVMSILDLEKVGSIRKEFIDELQSAHDYAATVVGVACNELAPWYRHIDQDELIIVRSLSAIASKHNLDESVLSAFSSCAENAPTVGV